MSTGKFWTEAIKEMATPKPKTELDFYEALKQVIAGKKITRKAWGTTACVFLHAAVLHLRKEDGTLHALLVSEGDVLATDWTAVREI